MPRNSACEKRRKRNKKHRPGASGKSRGVELMIRLPRRPAGAPPKRRLTQSAESSKEGQHVHRRKLADPLPRTYPHSKDAECLNEKRDGDEFRKVLQTSYCGFEVGKLESLKLRSMVDKGLETLRREGFFHYDIVQFNERVNSTRVQRVLVGEPGMTYLYQQLRLFALPWTDSSIANGSLLPIAELNRQLEGESKELLAKKQENTSKHVRQSAGIGRCDFNVALINAALVNRGPGKFDQPFVPFREDARCGVGKVAVNWHKDSTLEPFSTIAVYHHTPDEQGDDSWEIAMCCEQAPPVRVPLQDHDCYFMLGNFNHHHMHAVVAGKSARYASTHRVAVTHGSTYEHISKWCERVASRSPQSAKLRHGKSYVQRVREVGELSNTLEFDWIRQFYVQGSVHARQHATWWTPRIERLVEAWSVLDEELSFMIDELQEPDVGAGGDPDLEKAKRTLHYLLSVKSQKRVQWAKRVRHRHYTKLPQQFRPIVRPNCAIEGTLPEDLSRILDWLS